jgi:flavin reductase (DIM6/NTAB) family NADH-FMN oxidoreductase RutF/rubredoxin
MINYEALFKISYGLYVVCSGNKEKGNGFISNTVFQVTAEPPKFAACCNKDNYTSSVIEEHGHFSVSVLHKDTDAEIFGRFGYRSGRDFNKFDGMELTFGETGVPIVMNECVAFLECKVVDKYDVGTHWIFIGELIQAEIVDDSLDPITYAYYRQIKKGMAPKNAPTYVDKSKLTKKKPREETGKYQCSACGHIYDESKEDVKFADLPDDWTCPVCGADKEDFYKV